MLDTRMKSWLNKHNNSIYRVTRSLSEVDSVMISVERKLV